MKWLHSGLNKIYDQALQKQVLSSQLITHTQEIITSLVMNKLIIQNLQHLQSYMLSISLGYQLA